MKKKLLTALAVIIAASLLIASCSSGSKQKKRTVRHMDDVDETEEDDDEDTTTTTESSEETIATTATSESAEPSETESGPVKVGIINNDPNESGYRTANDKDMKETFTADEGYDAVYFYSLKNDEMVSAAYKFLEDGVDYLLISPADTAGWEEVLQDAQDAGVKVIFFDRYADVSEELYESMVIPDMEKQGWLAVDWLEEQDLPEYNVLHIQGVLGSVAQVSRGTPLDYMGDEDPNWNITLEATAEWDAESAKKIVEEAIEEGIEFNVIYSDSDNMTKGAVAALDEANITHGVDGEVMIVSFDCNEYAMEEVLMGNWNCEVQSSPFMASYIDKIIKGEVEEKTVFVEDKVFDAATMTWDDVDKYGL